MSAQEFFEQIEEEIIKAIKEHSEGEIEKIAERELEEAHNNGYDIDDDVVDFFKSLKNEK